MVIITIILYIYIFQNEFCLVNIHYSNHCALRRRPIFMVAWFVFDETAR